MLPSALVSLPQKIIARLPQSLQATVFMVLACAAFSIMTGFIRHISETVPPLEIVFFRNVFGLMALLPWFWSNGMDALKTTRFGMYFGRSIVGTFTMCFWFVGVSLVPLAEATALSFTSPLFATILAIIFLGEVVRIRRWTAMIVGFAGAMIILRPVITTIEPGTVMVLLSAATMASASIFLKKLMATDTPAQAVAWAGILMVPMSFIPALFVWVWPSWQDIMWLVALGVTATMGHICFSRAFKLADVSAVLPFDFTRLPFAALVGYLAFSEIPDIWTWTGAAVIFASSIYISWRESRLKPDDKVPVATTAGASRSGDGGLDVESVAAREDRNRSGG